MPSDREWRTAGNIATGYGGGVATAMLAQRVYSIPDDALFGLAVITFATGAVIVAATGGIETSNGGERA